MIEARPRASLGSTRRDGVAALHHFCFAGYHAVGREGWGSLRVLNHVDLAPHAELPPQPIDGVELLSIVRKGVIAHSGSLGGNCRSVAGEVQLISTGPGITHADINPATRPAEYFEIRIRCDAPAEQAQRRIVRFPNRDHTGHLVALASGFPEDRPAPWLNAPARVSAARIPAMGALDYAPAPQRFVYVVPLSGRVEINGVPIDTFEGAAIVDEHSLRIEAVKFAEILLIDSR